MAGAFSGRLINSYQPNSPLNSSIPGPMARASGGRPYQPNSPLNSSIVTHDSMSFNPAMHGTPLAQQSFSLFGSQASFADDSINEETAKKIASLQAKLNQKLGPEFISQRPGPGGGPKLTYAEGWKIINLANEVFGFNGWSSSIVSLNTDFVDFVEASGRYNVGVTAIVRVTLRDGTFHEDVGYGLLDNGRQKGPALDKSKKEAVTDAIKRALRNFGNVLGNCLYDKSYTSEVVKMKIPPVKFKKEELHRLPEFDDVNPDMAAMSASTSSTRPVYPNQHQANAVTPTRQPVQRNQTKPLSSIPAHVRSEIPSLGSTSIASTSNTIQADVKGPVHPTGLNTPITPPHRPNLNPLQHQHQLDRRVSFADHQQTLTTKPPSTDATMNSIPRRSPTDIEADESFGFNSDDDALFALADLGPPIDADGADAGRPIGSDEGRPINSNEGLLVGGSADDTLIGEDVFDEQHQKKTEPSVVGVVSAPKLSRRELIAAALVSVEDKADATSDSDPPKGHGYASGSGNPSNGTGAGTSNTHDKTLLQANAGTNTSSSTSALGVRSSIPPQQQQQNQNHDRGLNLTSLVQQRYQRHTAQRQNQNENPNQMSSSSRDESKRASTPSIGGFHFPPGINPQQDNLTSSTSSPSIGSKRPAEAMASNTTHTYRTSGGRPGIGMGLQQSISGPGVSTGTREILGRLEVGEGGDVKRMKR